LKLESHSGPSRQKPKQQTAADPFPDKLKRLLKSGAGHAGKTSWGGAALSDAPQPRIKQPIARRRAAAGPGKALQNIAKEEGRV